VLEAIPAIEDANVLVGFNTADDAGVVKISEDLALIQTVDVFTPVVDDPYDYGQIAAANSISDVYAMGGTPICALNIMGFPQGTLPLEVMIDILKGGHDKAKEAGISIVGGHTIRDKELKYGLAVTGRIHPRRIVTNANAKIGDRLFLTKPLGSGVISTAIRAGKATEAEARECIEVMKRLNRSASEAMVVAGANSATDVTGFGFLGHAWEMAYASRVKMVIYASKVPLMKKNIDFIKMGTIPGGSMNNKNFLEEGKVNFAENISGELRIALCDAQTSGGLFISLAPEKVKVLLQELRLRKEQEWVWEIGKVVAGEAGKIEIK
jgi:selenide,water dikinase